MSGCMRLKSSRAFIMNIDTTKSGSASNTFVLPLPGEGDYDYMIDWGDGTVEHKTGNTDETHVYAAGGLKTISITGRFPRIYFNDSGDCMKLISAQLGGVGWTSLAHAFAGCMSFTTIWGYSDTSQVTDFSYAWYMCRNLWKTTNRMAMPWMDVSRGVNFSYAWYSNDFLFYMPPLDFSSAEDLSWAWAYCNNMRNFPFINTSRCKTLSHAWDGACTFSAMNLPLIDTSQVTDFSYAWNGTIWLTSLPLLDTSKGTNFDYAWKSTQLTSIPLLNLRGMTSGDRCLDNSSWGLAIDTASYSALLIDMALGATNNVVFGAGNSKYNASAVAAHATLEARGWVITDGGLE